MIRTDPIIAVKNVENTSRWYQELFGCSDLHGGYDFAILTDGNDEILLCLHLWGDDEHPTMVDPEIPSGNGLILYFRTDNLQKIRQNAEKLNAHIEEDIHKNPNSRKTEFSVRDPDGYYLTISEFHVYEG